MKILIMGLPGSGKTTLAQTLSDKLEEQGKSVLWLNADKIRTIFNDWDFSYEGRIRQAVRMMRLARGTEDDIIIADFVAPLQEMRDIFAADFTVWVDTIPMGRFEDTNKMFERPISVDVHVITKDADSWVNSILAAVNALNNK